MYTHIDDFPELELMASLITINVKHTFSEEELKQQSEMMAQTYADKQIAENEKKVAVAGFKTKIDTFEAKIKLHASNINHGFTYVDKNAELFRDYANAKRVYFDKATGNYLSSEPFHASDFQKKLDFEDQEKARQEQIVENNETGGFAEGDRSLADDLFNPIDEIIIDKKVRADKGYKKGKKEKPVPKDNLHPNHGKFAEPSEELGVDKYGNPTDINPVDNTFDDFPE